MKSAHFVMQCVYNDRLYGLVVRVPGCKHRGPGFDCRVYQIFWVKVGLERDPISFVRINEELLERKSSDSGLKDWDYVPGVFYRANYETPLYPQKLTLTFAIQWPFAQSV
jgi:hypothetical protein